MASPWPRDGRIARALIGAAAIYALVLSGYLGALRPDLMPAGLGDLCGEAAAPAGAPHGPADHQCCVVACATALAGIVVLPTEGRPAPLDPRIAAIAWAPTPHAAVATLDPIAPHARGPPRA